MPAKLPSRRLFVSTAAALLLMSACASGPTINSSWRDPAFAGPPKTKPLVLGISRSDTNRRIFEDGFVQGIKAAGINGIASHTLMAESGNDLTAERLQAAITKSGADSLMTMRVISIDRRVNVVPGPPMTVMAPRGMGFHPWYSRTWTVSQPDVIQYDLVTMETTLWDIKNDRVIWTATSETTRVDNVARLTEGLAAGLVPKMKADGVL